MERRLLFVFAHPDDETFATGGTIAKYSEKENTKVYLYSATKGDAGKTGNPPVCSPEELHIVREQELRRAAKHLGIDQIKLLDHKDGKLDQIPVTVLSEEIVQYIEEIRPDVVVTFAPHGISGHKDHQIIQQAVLQAICSKDTPVKKLYYITVPQSLAEKAPRRTFFDPDTAITTTIDCKTFLPALIPAILEHRSQNLSIQSVFPGIYEGDYSYVRTVNHYILAWHHQDVTPSLPETDLFSGIS